MANMQLLGKFKDIKNEAKDVTYPDTNLKAGGTNVSVAEDHEKRIAALEGSVEDLAEAAASESDGE